MGELRPTQRRRGAKKLTPEVLKSEPLIAALARIRAKQIRAMRAEKDRQDLFGRERGDSTR